MSSPVLCGIYASRPEAENVRRHLAEGGLPYDRIEVVERVRADDRSPQLSDADGVLKNVLIDGAAGTVVGIGLGAIGEAALVAANITLFTASPFIAPLAMIGWGAALGGLLGAALGPDGSKRDGTLSNMVLQGIRHSHVTLIAHTRNEQESKLAMEVIGPYAVEPTARRSEDRRH